MDSNVTVALVTGCCTGVVGISALLLNYRGFNSLERRMEVMEGDLKQFYKHLGEHTTDIQRLKDKTGLDK